MSMVVTTRSGWRHRTGARRALLNPRLRSRARHDLLIIGDDAAPIGLPSRRAPTGLTPARLSGTAHA